MSRYSPHKCTKKLFYWFPIYLIFLDIGKSLGTFSAKARNIEEDREGERERTRGKLFRVTINIPRRRRRRKRGAKRFLLLLLNGHGGLPSLPPKNAGLYVRATPPEEQEQTLSEDLRNGQCQAKRATDFMKPKYFEKELLGNYEHFQGSNPKENYEWEMRH